MFRVFSVATFLMLIACSVTAQQGTDDFSFSVDHRSRLVSWDKGLFPVNGWEALFSRHRTIVGATWKPLSEIELHAALGNEFFSWYESPDGRDFTLDEIFFDNLYLRWKPEAVPLTLTVGRQNMMFGEGFVMMDGSPLDGSRSIYFNALRADWVSQPGHTLTAFALHQPPKEDLLPVIHAVDRALFEEESNAVGVYYRGTLSDDDDLDAYYLLAGRRVDAGEGEVPRSADTYHMPGIRYTRSLHPRWRVTGEANVQLGRRSSAAHPGGMAQQAWSWYAYASWVPLFESVDPADGSFPSSASSAGNGLRKAPLLTCEAGMYQYSGGGDADNGSPISQQFAPLFARWPKWSESFIYTLIAIRGGVAEWTNVMAPFVRCRWHIGGPLTLRAMLQRLYSVSATSASWPGDDGGIGTLGILEVKYDSGRGLTGHVLMERMFFDDAPSPSQADGYIWSRLELRYRLSM
ncbi:hypothetical protein KQI65_16420 [bacterium]|nr:hypothetical protein [bacterium]